MEVGIFFALPLVMVLAQRLPWRSVFRVRPLSASGWGYAVLLGLLTFPLTQGINSVLSSVTLLLGAHLPDMYGPVLQLPFAVQLAFAALLPAICEEWAFRGFVLSGALRLPPARAALLTGILFAGMHLTLLRFLPLALLGTILSLAVLRTGSLLPGMIGHLLNNGIALVLLVSFSTQNAVPQTPGSLLISMAIWGTVAIMAGFGVRAVLRRMGPLPAGSIPGTPTPAAPWELPWRTGEQRFWLPLLLAGLIFLLASAQELASMWGAP